LKGNFKNSGTLHKDLLESSVGKVLGGYVIDPTAKQVYIGLVEQKDWKYSKTLKFLSHISHWKSNEDLESFATKNSFLYFPLKA